MFRIGIIGSDNSHADAFSKLINIPDDKTGEYRYPDCKVVGIFGLDRQRTAEVAKNGKIEFIAEKPEDLMSKVDAVMVVFRHGDLHMQYALPFIEAGVTTWIDKPFTVKTGDAKKVIEAAVKNNTLLAGGSTCKYTYDILMAKNAIENGSRIGKIKTAVVNFPASSESEYAGIHFYGSHLAEMTLTAFGHNPKSVIASENNGCVTAILKYDFCQITMNFIPDSKEYFVILYGEKGTIIREIDISLCYRSGLEKFIEMLRTHKLAEPFEKLYAPVELLNATEKSYKTGTEVTIKGLEI